MKDLDEELLLFLKNVSAGLTEFDIENAQRFIKHGEYGVAFELICDQLYENDYLLTKDIVKSAQLLAEKMGLKEDSWFFLKENIW